MLRAISAVLVLLLTPPAFAQGNQTDRLRQDLAAQPFVPLVVSHRAQAGVSARIFPENSLAAMELAINRGVAIIEIDLRLTSDGIYVLMHDETLNRTTDVMEKFADRAQADGKHKGKVLPASLTLDEIKTLRLTDGFDGGDHNVPTVREALALAEGRVILDLDIKEFNLDKLRDLTEEFGSGNLMAYNSDPEVLRQLRDATGIMPLPINKQVSKGGNPIADFERYKAMFGKDFIVMHTRMDDISPELSAHAAKNGVRLWINVLEAPDAAAERLDYSLWNKHIQTGANIFQTDMALELTTYLRVRTECARDFATAASRPCAVFELDGAK